VNVAGELVVLDHLSIMAANGFEFDVDQSAPAGAPTGLIALLQLLARLLPDPLRRPATAAEDRADEQERHLRCRRRVRAHLAADSAARSDVRLHSAILVSLPGWLTLPVTHVPQVPPL
jgi:hypothetical protein